MSEWQFTNVAWLYVAATLISLIMAVYVWNLKHIRGSKYFTLMAGSTAIWSFSYLFGFFNTNMAWKLVLLRIEYTGVVGAAFFWLLFIITYTDNEDLLTTPLIVGLVIIPIVTLVAAYTVNLHGLLYKSYYLEYEEGLLVFKKNYGPIFYVWILYGYTLLISGTILLIHSISKMPDNYKGQIFFFILAIGSFLVPNFLYVFKVNVFTPYDPSPFSFVFSGLAFAYLMRKYRFLDVVPVAHSMIFNKVKSAIIILDGRFQVQELNHEAKNLLNGYEKEIVGEKISGVLPELEEIISNFFHEKEFKTELRIKETNRIYEAAVTKLMGKSVGYMIMLYDITELKNMLEELETYAHTVAHDLKNPLASLGGFTTLLQSEELSWEEKQECIGAIYDSSKRMSGIVEGLLMLASVRRQKEMKVEVLNMESIVEKVISEFRSEIKESFGELKVVSQLPDCKGFGPWVQEVWVNYISNAIKYGGSPPSIAIGAEKVGNFVRYWVSDNGDGIEDSDKGKLFREFSRLEQHITVKEGQGLGLSIVKKIIRKLGGDVSFSSIKNEGSTFYFTLPSVPPKEEKLDWV